jgi:phosphoglycolate phosphatase
LRVFNHLFCDFDGTLVDSSDGILETLRSCLASSGSSAKVELTSRLIGPPLRVMLQTASGSNDLEWLAEIETAFRREYDERGYLATRPYPGIVESLAELRAQAVRLHIVTNKRLVPTLKILDMLRWSDIFSTVNTLDSSPAGSKKTQVVAELLSRIRAQTSEVVLVGDTADDAVAARDNGILYAWASWGYGREVDVGSSGVALADAKHLVQLVLHPIGVKAAHGA